MREYEGNDLHFKITPLRENKYLSTCHHISKLSFERERKKKILESITLMITENLFTFLFHLFLLLNISILFY